MNAERWGQIHVLFDAAVGLASTERVAFLNGACGDSLELRDEVAGLLAEHDAAHRERFLEPPFPAELDSQLPPDLRNHARYRVLRRLGEGGMGTVYLAEHLIMRRLVALKVIRSDLVSSPRFIERFDREVRAAAKLSDPNIVAAYDAEQVGGSHVLVMEYVEGIDLARLLRDHGPMPLPEACDAVRQVASGLEHAFKRGMVHRDIKPQNLMRTPDGVIKILDFGVARVKSEEGPDGGSTGPDAMLGTADYMAPEQIDDPRLADIRADIYSMGCTLYALLSGRPPFAGRTVTQKFAAHGQDSPAPLAVVPAELNLILVRMMAKKPADRYQTPIEVVLALAPFVDGTTLGDRAVAPTKVGVQSDSDWPPIRKTRPAGSACGRRSGVFWALVTMLLGIAIVGLMIAGRVKPLPYPARQAAIVLEIEKLKGKVLFDEGAPGRPVTEVDLSKTGASDATLEHLAGLTGLRSLNLLDTPVGDEGLRHLGGLHASLRDLNLYNTAVTDAGLEHLRGLPNLATLTLHGPRIGDEGLVWVERMHKLATLDLSETSITDAGLARMQKLTGLLRLDLGGTRISDAGLGHLKGLTHLRWLNLHKTLVTDAGVSDLQRALPGVEIIR